MARRVENLPDGVTLSQLIASLQDTLTEVGDVSVHVIGPLRNLFGRMVRDRSSLTAIHVEDGKLYLEG